MLMFVVFLSFVACTLGAAIPEDILLEPRIAGGIRTTIGRFPYQISLQEDGQHICGGSIYNNTVIITASHCLVYKTDSGWVQKSKSSLSIRAGSSYSYFGGVVIGVASFKIHPDFNRKTAENDIAAINLISPLNYSSFIKSIDLAPSSPANGARVVAAGWGSTVMHGSSSIQLQYVKLNILDHTHCAYRFRSFIKDSMICANSAGRGVCSGDSGGPLVSNGVLVGVACAILRECGDPVIPDIYTDISQFRSWIVNGTLKEVE